MKLRFSLLFALFSCLYLSVAISFAADTQRESVGNELIASALERAQTNRAELEKALSATAHVEAMRFLIAYMPEPDLRQLSAAYLLTNVDFAYRAREATPWGPSIPDEIFFNDVLPYASINERRDDWRREFFSAVCRWLRSAKARPKPRKC